MRIASITLAAALTACCASYASTMYFCFLACATPGHGPYSRLLRTDWSSAPTSGAGPYVDWQSLRTRDRIPPASKEFETQPDDIAAYLRELACNRGLRTFVEHRSKNDVLGSSFWRLDRVDLRHKSWPVPRTPATCGWVAGSCPHGLLRQPSHRSASPSGTWSRGGNMIVPASARPLPCFAACCRPSLCWRICAGRRRHVDRQRFVVARWRRVPRDRRACAWPGSGTRLRLGVLAGIDVQCSRNLVLLLASFGMRSLSVWFTAWSAEGETSSSIGGRWHSGWHSMSFTVSGFRPWRCSRRCIHIRSRSAPSVPRALFFTYRRLVRGTMLAWDYAFRHFGTRAVDFGAKRIRRSPGHRSRRIIVQRDLSAFRSVLLSAAAMLMAGQLHAPAEPWKGERSLRRDRTTGTLTGTPTAGILAHFPSVWP